VPAVWVDFYAETGIPAAVKVGTTLRLTGHTGETADGIFPSDPQEQVRQTFRDIALTLAEAGAAWPDVVEINSYRVGSHAGVQILLGVAAEFLQVPFPAWTDVGVTELYVPEALVEIRCVAELPARSSRSDLG